MGSRKRAREPFFTNGRHNLYRVLIPDCMDWDEKYRHIDSAYKVMGEKLH